MEELERIQLDIQSEATTIIDVSDNFDENVCDYQSMEPEEEAVARVGCPQVFENALLIIQPCREKCQSESEPSSVKMLSLLGCETLIMREEDFALGNAWKGPKICDTPT